MAFSFFLEKFTPAQAVAIAGVPAGLQRSYRQRGYLSQQAGHAPFTAFGLAELVFAKAMADAGRSPELLIKARDWAVSGIVYRALDHDDAYASTTIGLDVDLGRCASSVLRQHSPIGAERARVIPGRYLLIGADGAHEWVERLDPALSRRLLAQPLSPLVVLDQKAMGDALRQRVGRPLVRVSRAADLTNNLETADQEQMA